jgi:hypothetical protein
MTAARELATVVHTGRPRRWVDALRGLIGNVLAPAMAMTFPLLRMLARSPRRARRSLVHATIGRDGRAKRPGPDPIRA